MLDLLAIANHFDNFVGGIFGFLRNCIYVIRNLHFHIFNRSVNTETALELMI